MVFRSYRIFDDFPGRQMGEKFPYLTKYKHTLDTCVCFCYNVISLSNYFFRRNEMTFLRRLHILRLGRFYVLSFFDGIWRYGFYNSGYAKGLDFAFLKFGFVIENEVKQNDR